ncbi:hypothetical protein Tco_0924885 [Tanacetum coccineum]|uniref:Uncharacterized protein n=1 Tax=Tanacetum coccineum TaxID=301880 RepID=A0ABQ5D581_9ASTR
MWCWDALALHMLYCILSLLKFSVIYMLQFWLPSTNNIASYHLKIESKKDDSYWVPCDSSSDMRHSSVWCSPSRSNDEQAIWTLTLPVSRPISNCSGVELKAKKSQMKSDSTISSEENHSKKKPAKGKKDIPSTKKPAIKPKPTKKKAPVKVDRGTGFNVLSEVALSEASQLKEAIKRNKQDSHVSHASVLGDGTDFESGVFDEQHHKIFGTDEGTSTKLGVPDVPKYDSESEKKSWGNSDEDDDENDSEDESDDGDNDDDGNNEDDGDNYANDDDNQEDDDKNDDEEDTDKEEEKVDDEEKMDDEEDDEVTKELYKDINVNLGNEDARMTIVVGRSDQTMYLKNPGLFKLLNLDNPSPTDNEIASLMDTIIRHEEPSNRYIGNKLGEAINKSIQSHIVECREEALSEKKEYIDRIETSVRAIIKEEVSSQLPQILPQTVSDFATRVIEWNITESVEAAILTKSSSQPKSTYAAATSFSEFELTKILMKKMEEHKSYKSADYKRELYDALVKSYNTDKDVFESYVGLVQETRSDLQLLSLIGIKTKLLTSAHPQTWTSQVARAEEPPTSFDELINTPIDFSAFFLNRLNIIDLTQAILVGPAFNLLKGTYKIRTKLEYHFEEFFKATTECLNWHNPEGKQYPFDLCKPLLLIPDFRGRQVIPQDYFINNDLEYLKVGGLSRRYSTSVTKTKAATYEIKWIEDMVLNLWSPVKQYDYGHLEEIEVRREDQQLYRSDLRKRTAYTAYSDPQGVIYVDWNNRNRLMHTDKLHKFSDGTLKDVWTSLHDIASRLRMEYLPKKKWSNLDKRRAHVMIQDIDKQLF